MKPTSLTLRLTNAAFYFAVFITLVALYWMIFGGAKDENALMLLLGLGIYGMIQSLYMAKWIKRMEDKDKS